MGRRPVAYLSDPKADRRIWKKAVTHTLYPGLPDRHTLRHGSGDRLAEQARPLLQVEDIRAATGGQNALLDSRDNGFYVVDMPEFWERPEVSGMIPNVRTKPDKYARLAAIGSDDQS